MPNHRFFSCRNRLTFAADFFFIFSVCTGQTRVKGSVMGLNEQPLSKASVLLMKATDSSLVKGAFSLANGQYSFDNIAPGNYFVSASFAGLKETTSSVFHLAGNKEHDLGQLQLLNKETVLRAVVVSARKPLFEQKIDRMVINVAASITNAGSTALDVLMRSPGVTVDLQNNALTLNGKDGVVVMMNGKISRMPVSAVVQLLAGMNAANIERIELITTPPANFDAEGNAGFINIVLKTNLQYGTNGAFTLTAGYGKKPLVAASVNFNHRQGRFNLFGDYSFDRTQIVNDLFFYRRVTQTGRVLETESVNEREAVRRNHNARLGIDIDLSKKTTIGFLVSHLSNLYAMDALNQSGISLNGQLDTIIRINNSEQHPLTNYSANVNLTHQFSAKQRLVLNADYIYYKDENTVDYLNRYQKGDGSFLREEPTKSLKSTPISFWVSSADYSLKLGEKADMEAGLKFTASKFVNRVRVERATGGRWLADPELTATFRLKENINAAYTSFNLQLGKRTSAKLGLRYEYTTSNLGSEQVKNILDRKYGNFFPSLFLSQQFNDQQSVNLAYSRRITRPTFNDMAPFVYFIDPNTYFSGNPALQPSVANAVKFDYLLKQLIVSFSYTHVQKPITNFAPHVDPATNRQTLSAENQKDRDIFSLNLTLPWKVNNWWNMQNNLSLNRQTLHAIYNQEPLTLAQQNLGINTTQSVTLPKDFSVELRGYFLSGSLFGIYRVPAFGSVDVGIQKKFNTGKSSLRLSLSDVFGVPVYKPSVDLPEKNLVFNGRLQFYNSYLRLTYTSRFGNEKVKAKRNRSTGSEDEQQRVNAN